MNPRVKTVVAKESYKLEITFTDGVTGIYDFTPLLDWGVFQDVWDVAYFCQARAADGTVVCPMSRTYVPTSCTKARPRQSPHEGVSAGLPAAAFMAPLPLDFFPGNWTSPAAPHGPTLGSGRTECSSHISLPSSDAIKKWKPSGPQTRSSIARICRDFAGVSLGPDT